MRIIDADDLYQKCIEIQLKKRNRYFDIDDVIKLIKKAPTVDMLDKIKTEIEFKSSKYTLIKDDGAINIPNKIEWSSDKLIKESEVINIINKYKGE